MSGYEWNTDKVFELAGGVAGVVELCKATAPHTVPPQPGTVAVWKSRGRIPAAWVPVIVRGLLLQGHTTADTLTREASLQAADVGL